MRNFPDCNTARLDISPPSISESCIIILPPQQAEMQRTFRKMFRKEISGRLLAQQGIILPPQRLEQNEQDRRYRLTYIAIKVIVVTMKIFRLLTRLYFGM